MSENIKLSTLTALIAAQSITVTNALGSSVALNIRDVSMTNETPGTGIVIAINPQDCPVLSPRALNFVTNVKPTMDTYNSQSLGRHSIEYDLTYQLYFYPLGEGGSWAANYGANAVCVMAIMLYFMTHSDQFAGSGSEDFFPLAIPALQSQSDATSTLYHGAEISFHVKHFTED